MAPERWSTMVRVLAGLVVAVAASCSPSVPAPAPAPAPPAPAPAPAPRSTAIADAAVDAPLAAAAIRDASSSHACSADRGLASARGDYPAPPAVEQKTEPPAGWFFDGRAWQHIVAACDLRDRVVMLDDKIDGPAGGSMWIWSRRDGAARKFAVDDTEGHAGHSTSTAKTAPVDDRVVDFIRDATMFHGRVGRTYPTLVDCREGDDQAVDYLVACSTKQHFAEIDTRAPAACTTFPDGVGWPLSIAVTDAKGARTITLGSLATISADRTTWTYRFGSGDDRVELELRAGATHGGELRFANQQPEPCAMIFNDERRTPAP